MSESKKKSKSGGAIYERRKGAPQGFPYAVLQNGEIVAWARDEATCERFAWSQALIDVTDGKVIRSLLNLLRYTPIWNDEIERQNAKQKVRRQHGSR
ncbi:MAG: hypothetical protein JST16_02940 [Bdellovibrionales bacterium]|nr:hypothetical protein [Bdellovibrionales bacterium]